MGRAEGGVSPRVSGGIGVLVRANGSYVKREDSALPCCSVGAGQLDAGWRGGVKGAVWRRCMYVTM